MPEDSKKTQDKRKNDPKEQRKPRNTRNQAAIGKLDRKAERVEESKFVPKVPQKPPVYEDPGPEFYKNLKRETDEILKITEEESSKYKKKEIQSNWSKYEMPIDSYEEIEEHDVGADYEKLIQAPLSIGGHFQFKHEKSWDVNTGPSLYDKYFEINMDNLSLAVSTIPFYERNNVEQSLFSETDMLSMNNRAVKYKQKYFNDKSYATSETEAHDRILSSLKESLSINKVVDCENVENDSIEKESDQENVEEDRSAQKDDINLDFKSLAKTDVPSPVHSNKQIEEKVHENTSLKSIETHEPNNKIIVNSNSDVELTIESVPEIKPPIPKDMNTEKVYNTIKDEEEPKVNIAVKKPEATNKINELPMKVEITTKNIEIKTETKVNDNPVETKKNPVIESPEDLEKWLDDFLDG